MYPMLRNCICILTALLRLYDKMHESKKQNTFKVTFHLSTAVKIAIILFLCGLLDCIRADLFMNNALYKCRMIKNKMIKKNIYK